MSGLDSIFRQLSPNSAARGQVHPLAHIDADVRLPDDVVVQAGAYLGPGVQLEPGCRIGPNVAFVDGAAPTIVRRGVQIGANATVLCGVEIGAGAMVGAGSVVTRDIPAGELWFGNPARSHGMTRRNAAAVATEISERSPA